MDGAMKPSHFQTPRGIRECTFEVRTPITTIETRGHAVLYMVCVVGFCVLCGLLIAGVL